MLAWDWKAHAEKRGLQPVPIKVQGITVEPGDTVILVADFRQVPRIYVGLDPDGHGAGLGSDPNLMSTGADNAPGPWPLDQLRHPDWLGGFVKEIDAE